MDQPTLRRHRWRNFVQTLLLAAVLAALLGYLAWLLGGAPMLVLALAATLGLYLFNPAMSSGLVLRMFGCVALAPRQAPALHALAAELAARAELPASPRLFLIPGRAMNAFATGTGRNAAVALSEGLLRALDLQELAGVLAHEIAHLRNRDMRVMGFADLATRVTRALSLTGQVLVLLNLPLLLFTGTGLSWWPLLVLVFAPALSALAQLALSRNREFDADLGAAELLGTPMPLISALAKLERQGRPLLERMLWPGGRARSRRCCAPTPAPPRASGACSRCMRARVGHHCVWPRPGSRSVFRWHRIACRGSATTGGCEFPLARSAGTGRKRHSRPPGHADPRCRRNCMPPGCRCAGRVCVR